jgi:hypothetical protein
VQPRASSQRSALLRPIFARRARRKLVERELRLCARLPYEELLARSADGGDSVKSVRDVSGVEHHVRTEVTADELTGHLRITVTASDVSGRRRPISDGFIMRRDGAIVGRVATLWFRTRPRSALPPDF